MRAHRFDIPGSFDPARSFLGRYLARDLDALQAEARYYLAAAMIVLAILIVNFLGWAVLKTRILGEPTGTAAILFWTGQFGIVAAFVGLCVVGFRERVSISVTERRLTISRGYECVTVSRADIDSVEIVPALTYHRHYRRYSRVQSFVARRPHEFVFIRAGESALAVGIDGEAARQLVRTLKPRMLPAAEDVRVAL